MNDLNLVLQVRREINEKKEPVSFGQITADIIDSIQNTINKEKVKIITNFAAVDNIVTLKSYMHSVFYNLISNSIKYRQKNISPVIEINSRMEGAKIILSFKDNGSGIDLKKNKDMVFGLYKRFHNLIEGKGMGLYMVKTQVEALGGKINIQSEVNSGTEFTVEFENLRLN